MASICRRFCKKHPPQPSDDPVRRLVRRRGSPVPQDRIDASRHRCRPRRSESPPPPDPARRARAGDLPAKSRSWWPWRPWSSGGCGISNPSGPGARAHRGWVIDGAGEVEEAPARGIEGGSIRVGAASPSYPAEHRAAALCRAPFIAAGRRAYCPLAVSTKFASPAAA